MTAGSGPGCCWPTATPTRRQLLDGRHSPNTLAEVRRAGSWAQSAAEREPGVARCLGAGAGRAGAVVAAVSVSGPIDRMGRQPGARWAADHGGRQRTAP